MNKINVPPDIVPRHVIKEFNAKLYKWSKEFQEEIDKIVRQAIKRQNEKLNKQENKNRRSKKTGVV